MFCTTTASTFRGSCNPAACSQPSSATFGQPATTVPTHQPSYITTPPLFSFFLYRSASSYHEQAHQVVVAAQEARCRPSRFVCKVRPRIPTLCCAISISRSYSRTLCRDDHILHARDDCEPANPANTLTDRLNTLLNSSGPGYTLPLCPSTEYLIQAPILFWSPNQEISTVGYPSGDERATLVVNGPVSDGQGHTTAVDGTCSNCSGVRLRNIQVCNAFVSKFCGPKLATLDQWYARRSFPDVGWREHRDGRV